MKIRQGFVSNSSSSSFCIYGAVIDPRKLAEKLGIDLEEDEDLLYELEYTPQFEEKLKGFSISGSYDDNEKYVGIEWSEIGKDETGAEFIKRIEERLSEVLGEDVQCTTHSEVVYD